MQRFKKFLRSHLSLKKLIFIFIALVFIISTFIISTIFTILNKRTVAEKKNDAKVAEVVRILSENGIATSRIASSKVDICLKGKSRVGFFSPYIQICILRYIEGFTTSLDRNSVKDKLKLLPQIAKVLDAEYISGDRYPPNPDCGLYLGSSYQNPKLIFISPEYLKNNYIYCKLPDQTGRKYYWPPPHVKVYSELNLKTIDSTKNQIWLIHEDQYFIESILLETYLNRPILYAP